jgi:hypothetical protein
MSKGTPDYHDADLVLRVYEMRRETVMRASRDAFNSRFWPANYDEMKAITVQGHELNAAYRQLGTYWEMVYGLVKHGIVHPEFFLETNGEGIFMYAKLEPYLDQLRKDFNPLILRNTEWVAKETERGRMLADMFRGRVQKVLAARA